MSDTTPSNPSRLRVRAIRRWITRIVLALLALGVAASVVVALLPKPVLVEVAEVRKARLTVTVDEDGRTRVKDRFVVSAPLTGRLTRIGLRPGDRVEANAALARLLPLPTPLLDPRSRAEAQANLGAAEAGYRQSQAAESRARAALEFAESDVKRQRQLAKGGAISEEALARAELELRTLRDDQASATFGASVAANQARQAQAALGRLDPDSKNADQMELQSPVDGEVLQVLREDEGVVQAGTPLLEIGNPAALELVVDVLTSDAVRIPKDARVRVSRWGGDQELLGHVRRVEPKAFAHQSSLGVEEQRVNVIIDLESPQEMWAKLGDGFRVEASIIVWEEGDVLQIPVSAAFKQDDQWSVYVVEGERAHARHVVLGEQNGRTAQIQSGLEPGARVIIHPGEQIADGTKVAPR